MSLHQFAQKQIFIITGQTKKNSPEIPFLLTSFPFSSFKKEKPSKTTLVLMKKSSQGA